MTFLKHAAIGTLAGAGILLGGAGLAQADQTAPETQDFALQQTTGRGADFPASDTLHFAGFNTALGTLTAVAITLSTGGDTGGSVTVTMTGGEGFGQLIDWAWINRQTNLSATAPSGISFAGSIGGGTSCFANTNGSCFSSSSMDVSNSQNGTQSVISPNLAPYMLSSFDINIAMSGFFDGSADQVNCGATNLTEQSTPPSCTGTADALWIGDISVVYTYDAPTNSPEPASLALLAGGLGGLAALRRRRR